MNDSSYVLFIDTDTDFTPAIANKYGYRLISMPYTLDDKEVLPYVDFQEFDFHEFYEKLRNGAKPKTSSLSPIDYVNYFEPIFQEGKDALYVHFSSAISGTFNALAIAEKELKEKYPERTLYRIDTKGISILSYNIACEIGDMYLEGKTPEELIAWADTEKWKFTVYFLANDLSFFRRSGRVKALTAIVGNLIGIRPIIYIDDTGTMTSINKARGLNNAVNTIVDYAKKLQDDIKNHRVLIAHADSPVIADKLKKRLLEEFGEDLKVEILPLNPTAGCHCGPDTVGVCFHSIGR